MHLLVPEAPPCTFSCAHTQNRQVHSFEACFPPLQRQGSGHAVMPSADRGSLHCTAGQAARQSRHGLCKLSTPLKVTAPPAELRVRVPYLGCFTRRHGAATGYLLCCLEEKPRLRRAQPEAPTCPAQRQSCQRKAAQGTSSTYNLPRPHPCAANRALLGHRCCQEELGHTALPSHHSQRDTEIIRPAPNP